MREATVERKLVEGVKKAGGQAWKFVSPGRSGVPDRIVLLPGGRVIFVELKTDTGKLSKLQIVCIRLLRELGFDARVLFGVSDVEEFLDEISTVGLSESRDRLDSDA